MTQPVLRAEISILDWVQGLARIPASDFTLNTVQHYMHQHAILPRSLKPYSFFTPKRYARNLIFKNEVFECLALCWDIGQASAIHNHNDKLGWIYLVEGKLFVQNYRIDQRDPSRHTCHISLTDSAELSSNNSAYVDLEQSVHKVCNLAQFNQRAISVHVYQNPLSQCEIYSMESSTYQVVELAYTSEMGRLNPIAS